MFECDLYVSKAGTFKRASEVEQNGMADSHTFNGYWRKVRMIEANAVANEKAISAALAKSLRALLSKISSIEVLGEWEAMDVNRTDRKKLRAGIDAVIESAVDALKASNPK